MNYFQLKMEIIGKSEVVFTILISDEASNCRISYSPQKREIQYLEKNALTQFIKLKEFQLRKILHNKRIESYYIGFKLNFVLNDRLPDTSFYDKTKITILDNRQNKFIVKKTKHKTPGIPELFTDGSFNHEQEKGGLAILIKTTDHKYFISQEKTNGKGNNLIELLALIKGIKYLKNEPQVRIVTDSQYVIKGVTEWLPFWKINNFYTVNGSRAKNIASWKEIDQLIKGKYLEFEWVKAHSDHFENSICDLKAKSIYKYEKSK